MVLEKSSQNGSDRQGSAAFASALMKALERDDDESI